MTECVRNSVCLKRAHMSGLYKEYAEHKNQLSFLQYVHSVTSNPCCCDPCPKPMVDYNPKLWVRIVFPFLRLLLTATYHRNRASNYGRKEGSSEEN